MVDANLTRVNCRDLRSLSRPVQRKCFFYTNAAGRSEHIYNTVGLSKGELGETQTGCTDVWVFFNPPQILRTAYGVELRKLNPICVVNSLAVSEFPPSFYIVHYVAR